MSGLKLQNESYTSILTHKKNELFTYSGLHVWRTLQTTQIPTVIDRVVAAFSGV